jgi:hypothetical protein
LLHRPSVRGAPGGFVHDVDVFDERDVRPLDLRPMSVRQQLRTMASSQARASPSRYVSKYEGVQHRVLHGVLSVVLVASR